MERPVFLQTAGRSMHWRPRASLPSFESDDARGFAVGYCGSLRRSRGALGEIYHWRDGEIFFESGLDTDLPDGLFCA